VIIPPIGRVTVEPRCGWVSSLLILLLTVVAFCVQFWVCIFMQIERWTASILVLESPWRGGGVGRGACQKTSEKVEREYSRTHWDWALPWCTAHPSLYPQRFSHSFSTCQRTQSAAWPVVRYFCCMQKL
jgi:hypothetical protein